MMLAGEKGFRAGSRSLFNAVAIPHPGLVFPANPAARSGESDKPHTTIYSI